MKKVILALLGLTLVISLYRIVDYKEDLNQSQSVVNKLQVIEKDVDLLILDEEDSQTILEDEINQPVASEFDIKSNPNKILLDEIKDYVGWIEVENSNINYPIVKTNDNDFYLNHDYYQNENVAGAIFMDRRNLGNSFDKHTIVYGHRMNNGTMFTDLDKFLDDEFLSTSPSIVYKDLFKTYEYDFIAAFIVSADDYYLPYEINEDVIQDFLSRSVYDSNYIYNSNHRYLTLSTCNYDVDNGRIIVIGVQRP